MVSGIMKRRKRKKVTKHRQHKKLRHPKKTNRSANRRRGLALGTWSKGK